jgi:hypothetical protein
MTTMRGTDDRQLVGGRCLGMGGRHTVDGMIL